MCNKRQPSRAHDEGSAMAPLQCQTGLTAGLKQAFADMSKHARVHSRTHARVGDILAWQGRLAQ
eukprot:CAMPEP_0204569846 /NCGR_PEP_ID=MMETSP0661-20131031/37987_1 /ASSEMBLY_ACC=CAM_ASM_000606 /TAXON_ID=109239 /ORGANISM="Alexandrium margalefi, Strain AMGDE01CS-322" /LENGTH=63 /DNA_ID=CAMNT_0051577991 /DNA_START=40 /DNA_END=229 /DNA_ORIENTATION=-